MSPEEMVEAVREVFRKFDWELDDRQYALEKIERIVTEPSIDEKQLAILDKWAVFPE